MFSSTESFTGMRKYWNDSVDNTARRNDCVVVRAGAAVSLRNVRGGHAYTRRRWRCMQDSGDAPGNRFSHSHDTFNTCVIFKNVMVLFSEHASWPPKNMWSKMRVLLCVKLRL